jgi:hypothetical protein
MMPVVAAMIVPISVTDSASPARHPAQHHLQRVEQIARGAGFLQHRAHEGEHRDRHQHEVFHRAAVDPQGIRVSCCRRKVPARSPSTAKPSATPPRTKATG